MEEKEDIEDLGGNQQSKEKIQEGALSLWENIKKFFGELLDIRHDTDRDATVEAVRKDIPFKGHNAWILIFSIFVASVGLNANSGAVVIGAMLISPLLGPIIGVGLSAAINDGLMMRRSLLNLGVMVSLSVLTAFIYFSISPLKELTDQLEMRTSPNILDVLIAIFGGLALIVAKTKKGTIASVIYGVAIATALMPPLCTVGYGLAVGNFKWAGGAFYLFSINAVFIALATFVVSKLLRFPFVKYANAKKRRRTANFATFIAVLVLTPSIYFFFQLWKKQVFETSAQAFITNTIKHSDTEIIRESIDAENRSIKVYLIGHIVPQSTITKWQEEAISFEGIEGAALSIQQGADQSTVLAERLSTAVRSGILEDLYQKNQEAMSSKDKQIKLLESEITNLSSTTIPFASVRNEARINYDGLLRFGYATEISTDFNNAIDTINIVRVRWAEDIPQQTRYRQQEKMGLWLKERFSLDTIVVEGNVVRR